jgi:L-alanine-DL-glutamate epimerase-like enolase superfamily enzyme
MELDYRSYSLEFKHPFGVSSNTRSHTTSVFVKLSSENQTGYGEACLPNYLGENSDKTIEFIKKSQELLLHYDATLPLHFFLDEIHRLDEANNAGKAALDIALHDLYGKIAGKTYYEMMGIAKSGPRFTSHTIGLDSEDVLQEKIGEAKEFFILKIKAGSGNDKELINTIRKYTDKSLYVDLNQGWTSKEEALEMVKWMKDQNVLLVEQPMAKERTDDLAWLTENSPLPIIADESVKTLADLEKLDGTFSGVNIKLMKSGGLREAMRMISYCKKNDLRIMLGCMAESSCGTTAMAQLMQYADFVDLDAPLLYKNDPFKGVSYHGGEIFLNSGPGNGAEPLFDLFAEVDRKQE